jgi:FKBP-type peptidyl-prolyl cis-trans isomerase
MAKRVVFIIIACLFLFTSLSLSGLVIWQMVKDSHNNKTTAGAQSQQTTTTPSKEGKLEGTKLSNFTPVSSISSLEKIDQKVGTGAEVKAGDTVTVHYTGAVAATGVIFQSSLDTGQAVTFPLSQVIKGWTEGIPGMKVGGIRRLVIPADQAYGATPPAGSGIPANAPLVFDVQLIKIGQ